MRSLLFVPGDSERKLAKALQSGADALLIDLEDSVAETRKDVARQTTAAALRSHREHSDAADAIARPANPRMFVRINGLQSSHSEDDLRTIITSRPDGIMLPKARDGTDVHRLSILLGTLEEAHGLPNERTQIIALATETAASIFTLPTYAGSSRRLIGLAWGAEDLSAEIGSRVSRLEDGGWTTPYRLVRDLTLIAATAAGVTAIDSVYTDLRNQAGLHAEAVAAARDGFSAKMALHPDQVEIINAAFTPSSCDLDRAQAIVRLFAEAPDAGVLTLDGQMLDRPHLERAKRLLQRAPLASPTRALGSG